MANPTTKTIISALTTDAIWNVDALTSAKNWNGGTTLGQSLSISFSFVSSLPSYFYNAGTIAGNTDASDFVNLIVDTSNPVNFTAFNPGQRVATDQAIYAWQAVANVTFNNVGDNNSNAVITLASSLDGACGIQGVRGSDLPYWVGNVAGTRSKNVASGTISSDPN